MAQARIPAALLHGEKEDVNKNRVRCPWCNTEINNMHAISNTVRFTCESCKLDAFITKLPKGVSIRDFQSRKTIA